MRTEEEVKKKIDELQSRLKELCDDPTVASGHPVFLGPYASRQALMWVMGEISDMAISNSTSYA